MKIKVLILTALVLFAFVHAAHAETTFFDNPDEAFIIKNLAQENGTTEPTVGGNNGGGGSAGNGASENAGTGGGFGAGVTKAIIRIGGSLTGKAVCGNGVCESRENSDNCPQDCPAEEPAAETGMAGITGGAVGNSLALSHLPIILTNKDIGVIICAMILIAAVLLFRKRRKKARRKRR